MSDLAQTETAVLTTDAQLKAIAEKLDSLTTELVDMKTELLMLASATIARLEYIDCTLNSEKRVAKVTQRKPKDKAADDSVPGDEHSTKEKKKKADDSTDPLAKVRNAMQWCRYVRAHNPELIADYITESATDLINADDSISKKTGNERAYAEGIFIWKSILSTTEQDEVRAKFKTWKEDHERLAMNDQLATDAEVANETTA